MPRETNRQRIVRLIALAGALLFCAWVFCAWVWFGIAKTVAPFLFGHSGS